MAESNINNFRKKVWSSYRIRGRHDLPWRKTKDPYKILVSEMMLQQTQVERVLPFYKKFIKKFGTAKKLAQAPLSVVLKQWQGLGLNRRAKYLHKAAKEFSKISLARLPGVGPYTARAVEAFAYNKDVVFVETNIRTAIIHHFFAKEKKVSDAEIEKILVQTLPKGKAREWYSALMDYGAYLKRSGISHNTRSRHYTKQSKFSGSLRQARGALLREYTRGNTSRTQLLNLLGRSRRVQMKKALQALTKEGLISENLLSGASKRYRQRR